MPKWLHIEMPFAPYNRAMSEAHSLSAVADLLVLNYRRSCFYSLLQVPTHLNCPEENGACFLALHCSILKLKDHVAVCTLM